MYRRSLLKVALLGWLVPAQRAKAEEGSDPPVFYSEGELTILAFKFDGNSMLPTLAAGDICLVDAASYRSAGPQRGDIVVFDPPVSSSKPYIKRVIGLPGETVEIRDGLVFIDGVQLDEGYIEEGITDCGQRECEAVTVPEGHIFVLGDNRRNSSDSRVFGPVEIDAVRGRDFFAHGVSEDGDDLFEPQSIDIKGVSILVLAIDDRDMFPTLVPNDFALIDSQAFSERRPRRGEIVAIELESGSEAIIRRIVGLPGETLELIAGKVIIVGYILEEPYTESFFTDCPNEHCEPVTIDADAYYVLADSRESGIDSRLFGAISVSSILGTMIYSYQIPGSLPE